MKKWLAPTLGALALSACSITFVFGLTTNPTIRTEYRLNTANGPFIGCDNITPLGGGSTIHTTQVRVSFATNADLASATVALDGLLTNNRDNDFVKEVPKSQIQGENSNLSILFQADSSGDLFLPTGVSKEGIIVVPAPNKVKVVTASGKLDGGFRAKVTAVSKDGARSTRTGTQVVPVYTTCTVVDVLENEDI